MSPDDWKKIQRVLVIKLGNSKDVLQTIPALQILRHSLPKAEITLMITPEGRQVAGQFPLDHFLVDEMAELTSQNPEHEQVLIEKLSYSAFDAAIIFTNAQESPYPLAYICYLAGIPIRLGQSQEFGGSVLSQCIKPNQLYTHPVDQHLFLLESVGFPLN